MIIDLKKYEFNKNDHSWMEFTQEKEYIVNNTCDNCDSKMNQFLFIQNIHGESGLSTGLCPLCGYIKRIKNLDDENIEKHFSKKWLSLRSEEFLKNDEVYNEVKEFIKGKEKILDVGCGNGDRLLKFQEMGLKITGVEPSEERSRIARKNLGEEATIKTNFAEKFLENNTEKYDTIFSFNVLQFVQNPFKLLSQINEHLNEDGILYLRMQRYDYSNFIQFALIGVVRSYLSLHCLKDFILKNNYTILKYTQTPLTLILKKGEQPNKQTIELLKQSNKISEKEIEKSILDDLFSLRKKVFNNILLKEGSMKRKVKLGILRKNKILPVQIVSNTDKIPIILK